VPTTGNSTRSGPWIGGVWYSKPVEDVQSYELSAMENTRVGQGGQVETRPGTASYKGIAALGSTPTLTMVAEYRVSSSTTEVIIVAGTAIYKESGSAWSAITGSVTVTAGDDNTWEWINANGTLIALNGVDINAWKYTGAGNASDLDDNARFTVGKHIAWFDNRVWIGNVNAATGQLWFSDIANIEVWGATSFFNFGGEIQGLVPMQNALAVHTRDGIYTLIATGNPTIPYSVVQRTGLNQDDIDKAGIDGRSTVAIPGDRQLMLLTDGIYLWSGGADLQKISPQLDGDNYWNNLNTSRFTQAFASYFPRENEVWFWLPEGTSQTNMNNVMVYNTLWNRWHGPYTGVERNCMGMVEGTPHCGDFAGILFDHDNATFNDVSTAIDQSFTTGAAPSEGGDTRVRWLYARHYYDGKGDFSMNVTQDAADLDGTSVSLDLSGSGFVLDEADNLDGQTLDPIRMQHQDTKMQGYGPHSSLKLDMNASGQSFTHRRIYMVHKPLGKFQRPKPVDK